LALRGLFLRSMRMLQALFVILAVIAVALVSSRATRAADFRVYYYASRVLIEGHGQLYGPLSGIGWPQYFRYPPFFLLAFLPFALLPYKAAAAVWAALKFAVLYGLIRALGRRLAFPQTGFWWLVPVFLCAGFVVQEFDVGNVQLLVFALTAASLLSLPTNSSRPALLLSFAASLKVWPLFFVPYLVARRHTRVAALTLIMIAAFMLLPAAYFGWTDNLHLLREWIAQEWGTGSMATGTWFPSQSLSGVLQRYLTTMDYSKWPDPNYQQINSVHLDPRFVPLIWAPLAACGYLGLLWLARKASRIVTESRPLFLLTDALAFCALPLIEPFAHRIAFVVLLWPAMVSGALLARRRFLSKRSKVLIWTAVAIEGIEPLIPGATVQRIFQVLGVDFWATCILSAGLLIAWMDWQRAEEAHQLAEPSPVATNYEFSAGR
jgi:glycosyl transferase family 87